MERAKLIVFRLYLTAQALLLVAVLLSGVQFWRSYRESEQLNRELEVATNQKNELQQALKRVLSREAHEAFEQALSEPDVDHELEIARAKARKRQELEAGKTFDPDAYLANWKNRAKVVENETTRQLRAQISSAESTERSARDAASIAGGRTASWAELSLVLAGSAALAWVTRHWLRWLLKPPAGA